MEILNKFATISQNYFRKDDFAVFFPLAVINFFAFLIHLLLGAYFFEIGLLPLFYVNMFSVMCYFLIFFLNKKGNHKLTLTLIVMEVTVYGVLATTLLGENSNSHWFIIIPFVAQFFLMELSIKHKFIQSVIMIVALNYCSVVSNFYISPYADRTSTFLSALNTNVALFSLILVLVVNEVSNKIAAFVNSSDLKKFEDLSYNDHLTGLKNRRFADVFFEGITTDLSKTTRYVFAMIDIDNFKHINDTYGHANGDVVLKSLADILLGHLRHFDLVCRFGGEEFLIIMCDCELTAGVKTLDNIRKIVEETTFHTDRGEIRFTITIGASALMDMDITKTIQTCDDKLYEGKTSGKNKVVS